MHLWYLEFLFLFTLLLFPLFWWLRRGQGARLLQRLGDLLSLPGALVLLLVPTILLQNLVQNDASLADLIIGGL